MAQKMLTIFPEPWLKILAQAQAQGWLKKRNIRKTQKMLTIFPEPWLKLWAQAQAQGSGVAQEKEHSKNRKYAKNLTRFFISVSITYSQDSLIGVSLFEQQYQSQRTTIKISCQYRFLIIPSHLHNSSLQNTKK